jgi:anaerobic selenocysteine-containing dehydrogenase
MSEDKGQIINRRSFLKLTGAAAAMAAVGDLFLGGKKSPLFDHAAPIAAANQDEWLHGYCRGCFKPHCAVLVHVKDGVVVEVKGDPESPTNAGTLCGRGQAQIFSLYNPYRVKTPLKRTNSTKGLDEDPGWQEISWEEALTTITDHLNTLQADDPRKLVTNTGFGVGGDYYRAEILENFLLAYGSPAENNIQTNGPLCSDHLISQLTDNSMTNASDLAFANYVIALGGTMVDWAPADGTTRGFMDAIERGMKLVVVDPRANNEAARGEWIPIRPASELAFLLSMLNVMFYEIGLEKLDLPFLKLRSNAPYLIGTGERYIRDPESNKPLIWDAVENKAKVFDDPTIQDFALDGEVQLGDQTVSPGLALIKKEMVSYTPEWAEKLTTIPAATVRRITNEFVEAAKIGSTIILDGIEFPFRPAVLYLRRGGESSTHGSQVQMAKFLINELIGNVDVPGGYQSSRWGKVLPPNEDGVVTPVGAAAPRKFVYPQNDVAFGTFYPIRHTMPYLSYKAFADPEKYLLPYNVDTLVVYGANPIMSNASPDEAITALKKIPLVISVAYHLDEPAQFADIVLPEPSNMEREYIYQRTGNNDKGRWGVIQPDVTFYRYPVVSLYDAKQIEDILLELGKRLNLLSGEKGLNTRMNKSFKFADEFALQPDQAYSLSDILDRVLKNKFGADNGSEYFKKVGFKAKLLGPKDTYAYAFFPVGTTRYHFFYEHIRAVGDALKKNCEEHNLSVPGWPDMTALMDAYRPIPHWKSQPIHEQPAEYDMYCTNWKTPLRPFGIGGPEENPLLFEILKMTDPYSLSIWMNPIAAQKKGISDGDTIVVESYKGKMTGTVKLTGRIHPEVVGVGGNYGRRSQQLNAIAHEGSSYNQLLTADDGTFDPLSTSINISAKVKVYKA